MPAVCALYSRRGEPRERQREREMRDEAWDEHFVTDSRNRRSHRTTSTSLIPHHSSTSSSSSSMAPVACTRRQALNWFIVRMSRRQLMMMIGPCSKHAHHSTAALYFFITAGRRPTFHPKSRRDPWRPDTFRIRCVVLFPAQYFHNASHSYARLTQGRPHLMLSLRDCASRPLHYVVSPETSWVKKVARAESCNFPTEDTMCAQNYNLPQNGHF